MRKLLSVNFVRLWKSKLFWICIASMIGFGVLLCITQYQQYLKYGNRITLDNIFFGYTIVIGILCAAFSSLFLGTEYNDGTIRNKLIVGHTRSAIYLSNFLVNIVASLLMCFVFLVTVCSIGTPLIGFLTEDIKLILLTLLGSLLMTIAFCAICTLLSMLLQSKAVVSVVSLIGVFVMLFFSVYLMTALSQPETYSSYSISGDNTDETMHEEVIQNPNFVGGTQREIYKFLLDFLPAGQALQYMNMSANHLWQMPLYSLSIIVVTTGCGLVFFRKKDVK